MTDIHVVLDSDEEHYISYVDAIGREVTIRARGYVTVSHKNNRCPKAVSAGGLFRCVLSAGHEGQHESHSVYSRWD